MIRRFALFFAVIMALSTTGCIKETYDMKRLSKEVQLSPALAISAVYGNIGLSYLNIALNLRINNSLQIVDTLDNFMKVEGSEDLIRPENFEKLNVVIVATNEFPLRVSLQMDLYNSTTNTVVNIKPASANPFLEAAPVQSNGSTKATETTTKIIFTRDFLSSIPKADKIILLFTLSTPPPSTDFVTIKSDYRIYFKATLIMQPEINLK
jgi:hypothetical protein